MGLRSRARLAVRLAPALVAVCSVTLMLGAPSAFGATPSTPYTLTSIDTPFPQETGRFGERHAATNDIDGDRVNDYFVGNPSETFGGFNNAGRVYAISGRTRREIYDIESPEIQADAQFGFFISVLGDVNGDGHRDLAVGTDTQDATAAGDPCTPPAAGAPANGCNKDQGKAWVFSGRKGGLLYEVDNPDKEPESRFGSRIGRAGDLNGDGVSESIIGASNADSPTGCGADGTVEEGCRLNQGRAYIFDGRNGTLFRTLDLPASDRQVPATCTRGCGSFGLAVQGPGDVDGDRITDQLVNAGSLSLTPAGDVCTPPAPGAPANGCNGGQGAMYLFSGATGNPLARIDDPAPEAGATFGFQDAAPLAPGDVNGDGRADIYGNGFGQDGPAGESQGRMWVFDGRRTVANPGAHGVVLYEPKDPTPTRGGQCCFALDKTDYNKDGRPDLYVGASPHHISDAGKVDQSGGTYVFDGRNGALLKRLELTGAERQAGSGTFANLGSNLGWSVAAPGDLNGDGEPDYLAGAPFQDTTASGAPCTAPAPGCLRDAGKGFVFLSKVPAKPKPKPPAPPAGCPAGNSAGVKCQRLPGGGFRITGTAGNDTIVGSSRDDVISCGDGDDIVRAGAGDDVISCGAGNDRVHGGAGNDRLNGDSGNDRVKGSTGNDRAIGGSGDDIVHGNEGKDRVGGQSGDDRLSGHEGNDIVNGEAGNDRMAGNSGRDRMSGGRGNDRVAGGSGSDRVRGNSGDDILSGNSGNDTLIGDRGRDRLSGNSGNDRLFGGSGNDRLDGGAGRDRLSGGPGRDATGGLGPRQARR